MNAQKLNLDALQHQMNLSENENSTVNVFDVWEIIKVISRWWWAIFLMVLAAVILTYYIVSRIDPVYLATSVIEVKQQERQIFDQNSDVESFVVDSEFFNTQIELLRSDTLASDIIEQFNLINDPDFELLDGNRETKRLEALNLFSEKMGVEAVGRSRLIQVSFEHTNPRKAARITNAITDSFISYNLERKYNATSYARDFIEDRLKTTKEILEQSERELVEYASTNDLVTIRNSRGEVTPDFLTTESMITLNADLLKARSKRLELEKKYTIVEQTQVPTPESRTLSDLRRTLTNLQSEYTEKRAIYVPDFPAMIDLQSQIDYIKSQIESEYNYLENTELSSLKTEYEVAVGLEQNLQNRFEALNSSFEDIRDKSVQYNILEREVDTNRTQYDALLQRLKEVSIADDIGSNLISLVDSAEIPRKPFKPRKLLSLILAGFLASIIGTSIFLIIEFIDDRIKSPDDVKNKLGQIVMGVIPRVKNVAKNNQEISQNDSVDTSNSRIMSEMLGDPSSVISEAYAALRTNLQFSGPDGGPRIIHITSTRSGEGKSVTSLGLALRFAGLQENVLLIDADMRLPTFKRGADGSIGLSGLLTSNDNIEDNIIKTAFDYLYLLPSGANVPNPSEILSSYRLGDIIDHVRSNYSYVIVDSPPVMGLADASILAANCDASILVVEGASTRTPSVKATLERLVVGGIKVLGIVITKYTLQNRGYYNYYQYNYGTDSTNYSKAKKSKKSKNSIKKDYIDIITPRSK